MEVHDLKIWPQYFSRVIDGSKTFEVRENDRGYQPGDEVILREYDPTEIRYEETLPMGIDGGWTAPKGYSGRLARYRIGYVLPIEKNRVVFSLLPLNATTQEDR